MPHHRQALSIHKILRTTLFTDITPLFKSGQKLEHVKETSFKLEREIQQLTEQNLPTLLHLVFKSQNFL